MSVQFVQAVHSQNEDPFCVGRNLGWTMGSLGLNSNGCLARLLHSRQRCGRAEGAISAGNRIDQRGAGMFKTGIPNGQAK